MEVIGSTRLLGTIITNNLSWDPNISDIVKRSNATMELLRKLYGFGVPKEDMKLIYCLEQSAVVWHSSLNRENMDDFEQVQKSALKIILKQNCKNYKHALTILEMDTLNDRREQRCLNFALKCLKHPSFKNMFPQNEKQHEMKTRKIDKFKVQFA